MFSRDTTPPQSTDIFPGEQFMFDAVSTASALCPIDAYYYCMEHTECGTTLKLNMTLQWLNHLEQHNQVQHVHFVSDMTPDLMCPTLCNYNTILTGGVDLL